MVVVILYHLVFKLTVFVFEMVLLIFNEHIDNKEFTYFSFDQYNGTFKIFNPVSFYCFHQESRWKFLFCQRQLPIGLFLITRFLSRITFRSSLSFLANSMSAVPRNYLGLQEASDNVQSPNNVFWGLHGLFYVVILMN